MKGVKGRILRKLKSIPRLADQKQQPLRILTVHISDGFSSPPPGLRPSAAQDRALRELPVDERAQQQQQQWRLTNMLCEKKTTRPPPAAPEPDVIDVAELMSGLEDDGGDGGLDVVDGKENARPAEVTPSRAPVATKMPSVVPQKRRHLEESPFRRPDPNSATLFDPNLLAAFEQAVVEHIRSLEELRGRPRPAAAVGEGRTQRGGEDEDGREEQPRAATEEEEEQAGDEDDPWEGFELRCPPGGEEAAVLYTTSLRGVRKTFEDCSSVRFLLSGLGVRFCERDVSMHLGYREELWRVLGGRAVPPRLFVRGRCVGGADEVLGLHERGRLLPLLRGLRAAEDGRRPVGAPPCPGCGGVGFVVCGECSGSRRRVVEGEGRGAARCPSCNENGLLLCGVCSWSGYSRLVAA